MKSRHAFFVVVTVCVVGFFATPSQADKADNTLTENLRDRMEKSIQDVAPVEIHGTWYAPKIAQPGKKYPLAIVLASPSFQAEADSFWVKQLWQSGFCTVVLKGDENSWRRVRVGGVLAQLQRCPDAVPADLSRLLIISDNLTGSLAQRMADGLADRLAGLVMISFAPVEFTWKGPDLWRPREQVWKIPMWIIVGTRASDAAEVLQMWRKVILQAPNESSITIDTRLGRGLGPLLPDKAVERWLADIAARKTPAPGPDSQAQQQARQLAQTTQEIRTRMRQEPPTLQSSETIVKKEGPFEISVRVPSGWYRDLAGERDYNPRGLLADETGKSFIHGKNEYSEIYITPSLKGPFFARVCGALWKKPACQLLNDYFNKRTMKGYYSIPLSKWKEGDWAYEIACILMPFKGQWHRWYVLVGARSEKNTPATTLIFVLDSSLKPSAEKMADALLRLQQTARVKWLGRNTAGGTPQPLELRAKRRQKDTQTAQPPAASR